MNDPEPDLVDVVGAFVELHPFAGSNLKGRCPFCPDPSRHLDFQVSPAKVFYHYFSCQEGGDVHDFIRKIRNG